MKIDECIRHIIDGNAILFIGAGFSGEATNLSNDFMKDAKECNGILNL